MPHNKSFKVFRVRALDSFKRRMLRMRRLCLHISSALCVLAS
jgi:hypothetical protein